MLSKLQALTKKQIVLLVAVFSTFGVIGTTSFVQAAPEGKPTKVQCQAAGYTNYGQCVSEWGQNHGYGGNGGNNGGGGGQGNWLKQFFSHLIQLLQNLFGSWFS